MTATPRLPPLDQGGQGRPDLSAPSAAYRSASPVADGGHDRLIRFDGISRPIALTGCGDLLACFTAVLHGWRVDDVSAATADPIIRIHRKGGRYRLESPWLDAPLHESSAVGAVCSAIVDLVRAYIDEHPALLCLHCGAAAFAGRLVIFPSAYRAGKSTLMARLAAGGVPVYADDVMPITRAAEGVALGIAPRLRLPLPDGAGRLLPRFADAHRGPSDPHYLYLNLPPATLARHGRTAPIGAFVLLDRQPAGRAQLVPASKSQGLQRAILQNFARSAAAVEIVDWLRGLIDRTPCFTLHYADLDDAAMLLQGAFADWPSIMRRSNAAAPRRPSPSFVPEPKVGPGKAHRKRTAGRQYRRNPAVVLEALDDDLFLVDPRSQSIYHLNPVGAGLWHLLNEPLAAADAIDIVHAAFPDVDRRRIRRDVTRLLSDLLAKRLIMATPRRGDLIGGFSARSAPAISSASEGPGRDPPDPAVVPSR